VQARDEIEGGETMNKKVVFSLAASLAILGASFIGNTAKTEAAGPAPCPAIQNYEVKTVYPSSIQDIEKWVQFILEQTGNAELTKLIQQKPATTTVPKPSANVQTP
jgi:hypothetical protein